MSDKEELEPFEAKVVAAGHVLVREADGSVDIFVMDTDRCNGPGCSVCGDCWCRHCNGSVEPCDGGKAMAEAEAAARVARAAPDMLEALRLHDVYMDTPQDRGGAFGRKAQARAAFDDAKRAAIAKATGA